MFPKLRNDATKSSSCYDTKHANLLSEMTCGKPFFCGKQLSTLQVSFEGLLG